MSNNFNPGSLDSAADDSAEVQLRELDEYRAVLERGEFVTPEVWIERRPEARLALAALRGQFCLFEAKRLQPNAFGLETPPSSPDSTLPYAETPATHKPEIPGHEMLDECGRGGMGVVFKARHQKLDRLVAVKVIRAGLMANEDEVRRFYAEAQAVAKLQHPNIVAIHDVAEHDGHHYFSMDYIDGESLADVIRTSPLPGKTAAHYMQIVAEAIHFAHQNGVFHRDLKPSNILLQSDSTGANRGNRESGSRPRSSDKGLEDSESPRLSLFPPVQNLVPKITDFGLAKRVEGGPDLTSAGHALGTPSYMPPEQASGDHTTVGPWNDVYSLGATLYALVTGRPPFQAASAVETLRQVTEQEPVAPRQLNPAIDRDLETISLKCLQKEPTKRYASAHEFAADLGRYLRDELILARPVSAPERLWRWCRRKPVIAGLAAAAILLAVATTLAGAAALRSSKVERVLRITAQEQELQARRLAYHADVGAAYRAYDVGEGERALALLERQRAALPGGRDPRGFEWFYLYRICQVPGVQFVGHGAPVECVAASPDGRLIVSGDDSGVIRFWDAQTGEASRSIAAHSDAVTALRFDPEGKRIASASRDTTLRIFDAKTGELLRTLDGHVLPVTSLAFGTTGAELASGSADCTIQLWNVQTGEPLSVLQGHTSEVIGLEFRSDGKLVSASKDRKIRVWDPKEAAIIHTIPVENTDPWMTLGPDGETIAVSAGANRDLKLLDLMTGVMRWRVRAHATRFRAIAFRPDGKQMVTGGDDAMLKIWDTQLGPDSEPQTVKPRPHGQNITGVVWNRDGRIVSSSRDGTLRRWDPAGEAPGTVTLRGHTMIVSAVSFSPDSKRLVSASYDRTIRLWDVATGRVIRVFGETSLERGPDRGAAPGLPRRLSGQGAHGGIITDVAFSPHGDRVASCGFDDVLKIWDPETGRELRTLRHSLAVRALAWSPDGKRVATACWDDGIHVWNIDEEREVLTLTGHVDRPESVAFSPNGKLIASGGRDKTVRVWDAENGETRFQLNGHTGQIHAVRFSPDAKLLVSASADKTICVWDMVTGKLRETLRGHTGPVLAATFLPDGRRLASAPDGILDRKIHFWEVTSGDELIGMPTVVGEWPIALGGDGHLACRSGGSSIRVLDGSPIDDARPDMPKGGPEVQEKIQRRDPGPELARIKALGTLTAGSLWSDERQLVPPDKPGNEFLIVVVSISESRLAISDAAYKKLQKAREQQGLNPLPPINRISDLYLSRFKLQATGRDETAAVSLEKWPPANGFSNGWWGSSSEPLSTGDRVALAVAFSFPKDAPGPFKIQLDDDQPIVIPSRSLRWKSQNAGFLNDFAWALSMSARLELRDPALALDLARQATEQESDQAAYWNTLAAAEYRAGNWQACIAATQRSMDLAKGGDAFDWFFLAMAHWKLGQIEEARRWHDRAVDWVMKNNPNNDELLRIRDESASLILPAKPDP